jgi:hypothetical protein
MTSSFKDAVLTPEPEPPALTTLEVASPEEAWQHIQKATSCSRGSQAQQLLLQQQQQQHRSRGSSHRACKTRQQREACEALTHIIRDVIQDCKSYYAQFGFMDLCFEKETHALVHTFMKAVKLCTPSSKNSSMTTVMAVPTAGEDSKQKERAST